MSPHLRLYVWLSVALWGLTVAVERAPYVPASAVSDSAIEELTVGRYWHAARILRAEGAAEGTPDEMLLLATAEAGWENWAGVLEVLEPADWLDAEGADTA